MNLDLPPPGAYEIAEAFSNLKNKGRIDKTLKQLNINLSPRELFPGFYYTFSHLKSRKILIYMYFY